MARQIQTVRIDDIDGGEAEGGVRFALDGTEYEIDLSATHREELNAALKPFIEHARRVGSTRRATRGGGRAASAIDTHAVRTWAKEQGIKIKERGRVPADVIEQYRAAAGQ